MLTVEKIQKENGLELHHVFNTTRCMLRPTDNIQKVIKYVKRAITRHDLDELDEICQPPPLRSMGTSSTLEDTVDDIDLLVDALEEWQALAVRMFNMLPFDRQELFLQHLNQNIIRKAYIDNILEEL